MTLNYILERVAETASTNDDLLARWRANTLIDPVARITQKQTAGKGRAGRVWRANPGDTLCFSVAYPFQRRPSELSGLSLCLGLAVITGIASALNLSEADLYAQGLRLKWPNDLLLNNTKLGGILIEGGQTHPQASTWMIIGIGINLQNASRMERELGGQAHLKIGALDQLISATKPLPDTEYIWLKILDSCAYYLAEFERFGFSYFQASWSHWDAYQGQLVSISGSGQAPLFGEAVGVDSQGALILQRDKQSTLVHAGDVSLRVQA